MQTRSTGGLLCGEEHGGRWRGSARCVHAGEAEGAHLVLCFHRRHQVSLRLMSLPIFLRGKALGQLRFSQEGAWEAEGGWWYGREGPTPEAAV